MCFTASVWLEQVLRGHLMLTCNQTDRLRQEGFSLTIKMIQSQSYQYDLQRVCVCLLIYRRDEQLGCESLFFNLLLQNKWKRATEWTSRLTVFCIVALKILLTSKILVLLSVDNILSVCLISVTLAVCSLNTAAFLAFFDLTDGGCWSMDRGLFLLLTKYWHLVADECNDSIVPVQRPWWKVDGSLCWTFCLKPPLLCQNCFNHY